MGAADGLGRQAGQSARAVAGLLVHLDGDGVAGLDGASTCHLAFR